MSRAFDDFLAGQGGLAMLLRAVPAFEPSPELSARLASLAREAQASVTNAPTSPTSLAFEPPTRLEATFLQEAARLQAAQQARQDALVEALHKGQSPRELLGHDISEATTRWLTDRPRRLAQAAARRTPPPRWLRWAPGFAVVGVSALATVAALRLWPLPGHPGTAPSEAPTPMAAAAPTPGSPAAADAQAPLNAAAEPPRSVLSERVIVAAAPPARSRSTPQILPPLSSDSEADEAAPRLSAFEMARMARRSQSREHSEAHESAEAPEAESPAATALADAPAPAPALAAKAADSAGPAPLAAPSPALARAPASARPAPGSPLRLDTQLDYAPQIAARRWVLMGARSAPRILAANPASERVQQWVERFRLALPPALRPARLAAEAAPELAEDALQLQARP